MLCAGTASSAVHRHLPSPHRSRSVSDAPIRRTLRITLNGCHPTAILGRIWGVRAALGSAWGESTTQRGTTPKEPERTIRAGQGRRLPHRRRPERLSRQLQEDLVVGGDPVCSHAGGNDLRHELQAHARVELELRIPLCHRPDGGGLCQFVLNFQAAGLALTTSCRAQFFCGLCSRIGQRYDPQDDTGPALLLPGRRQEVRLGRARPLRRGRGHAMKLLHAPLVQHVVAPRPPPLHRWSRHHSPPRRSPSASPRGCPGRRRR